MSGRRDPVELLLAEAHAVAAWPPAPDVQARVVGRIEGHERIGLRPDRPRARRGPLVRAVVLAVLLLVLAATAALALGYRLPGLDILFRESVSVPPAGSGLGLGDPIPIGEATAAGRPRVLVPAALAAPDTAYRGGTAADPVITLAWRASDGGPTLVGGEDLGLVVMAVPGRVEEAFLAKVLGPQSTIEPVTVGGDRGWWISGAPHELVYSSAANQAKILRSVVAGDTLVFARDGTLYRLESVLGRDRTLEIAGSMR